jgi:DNA gyrase/topoisomerase IV subunit B
MSQSTKIANIKPKKVVTIKETSEKTIEEQFQKKTLHQHVLDRPSMYIGPIKPDKVNMYIYSDEANGIIRKDINVALGLYKIFDEILVNAADHTTRDKGKCNRIDVHIDEQIGTIRVKNNGTSVPIEFHKDEKMYVPEMIFGNLLTSGNYNDEEERLVGGTNGIGSKCIHKNTKIIDYYGVEKIADDIKTGDKLIGDDGTPRTVQRIIKGKGQMYEITQADGESYTVNNNHTLTLYMPDHKVIFWNDNGYSMLWWNHTEQCINSKFIEAYKTKDECQEYQTEIEKAKLEIEEFAKTIPDNNIIDINILDYMKLNETTTQHLAGIRSDCVQWEKQDVQMDPYLLGLLLGHTFNEQMHPQIIDYLKHISNVDDNDVNVKQLDKYNLINNKHIPIEYIVNDRETRLKVLAGIIDTNGAVKQDGKLIVITQEIDREQLVKNVVLLSRTLGFYTYSTITDTTWTLNGEMKTGKAYNINISGNFHDIPTLLPKNKCFSQRPDSIKSTGHLTIKDVGIDDYVGFALDGNQRFVINDFTVTHNCTNVYSEWFDIEIQDTIRHKKYYQRFSNNMYNKIEPVITDLAKTNTDSYTQITFFPDYKRFGLKGLTEDHIALFKRRVYDIAGTTTSNVKVYYNDEYIDIKTFEDYIKLFYSDRDEEYIKLVYQDFNERWSIGVVYDPSNEFRHMTFVNKISTYDGGTHLNYIIGQIVDKVSNSITSQTKYKSLKIKPAQVKDNLTVFINTVVENPIFGSQTKDALKTKASDFKVKCEIDDKFITKICKSGLLDEIIQLAQFKQLAELDKSAKKVTNLKKLVKLEDARFAGSKQGHKCTLILTEGDSAKKFAIDAFDVIGRDHFGVFPLKGKLLNVREATINQLINNEEIINLMQILGLDRKKTYKNNKGMRYGHILLLTDQDSVSADTPLLLKTIDNKYTIKTIETIGENWFLEPNGKETALTNLEIWTDKGWTKIVKVIRHKVNKKMFRVLTDTGVVDVTEDHSLLKPNGEEISPKECVIEQELMHSFPNFKELNVPNQSQHIYENHNMIDKNEAYVMGLFVANDSFHVDNTNNFWSITSSNIQDLNKAMDILNTKYNCDFKIICGEQSQSQSKSGVKYTLVMDGEKENGHNQIEIAEKYKTLFETNSHHKSIPVSILNSSHDVRENFFAGYCNGNDYEYSSLDTNNICFELNNKMSAQELFFLCNSLGYSVIINTEETQKEIYNLYVSKEKKEHNSNTIKKIIDLGIEEQYVYDLETENHHFQAGVGKMIVHNTDGTHIKGLIMNFIHTFWPSLVKVDGFIQSIATPIVKIFKKNDAKKVALHTFYTITEYKKWCETVGEAKNYEIKYYKGLGTSTDKEAIEAFTDYNNKLINYVWSKEKPIDEQPDEDLTDQHEQDDNQDDDDVDKKENQKNIDAEETTSVSSDLNDKNEPSYQAITLAFAKNRSNDRKDWLKEYDPEKIIENSKKNITYDEFVEYDLKHFSIYDNVRSIPDLCDGLKPSQRKILYGAIKRKLENSEVKVAQLSGYISEHTGYHHGEASLQGAIINMAQDFCGSNNINIFKPNGNFGSRRVGGEDAASSRYIFTQLNKLTKIIFNDKDSPILEHNVEEGDIVEPIIYYPIVPMILVNGCKGIGTGYSTFVPQYNPMDLIKNIKDLLNDKPFEQLDELVPWYRGFTGKIEKKPKLKTRDKEAYNVFGVATIINETTIRIKELPIGVWTEDYLRFLETQREDGTFIVDYVNNSSNHKVDIVITFANGQLQYLIKNNLIFSRLKLISSISIENMHLYKDNIITKYKSANAILKDYVKIRLNAYELRKKHVIKILANEMQVLQYRKKYIEDILEKIIIIERVTKSKLLEQIVDNEYPKLSINLNSTPSYDYLLSLPLTSLTSEKIDDLNAEYNQKKNELELYKGSTIHSLWLAELDEFEKVYNEWLIEMDQNTLDSTKKKTNTKTKTSDKKVKSDEKKQNTSSIDTKNNKVLKTTKN